MGFSLAGFGAGLAESMVDRIEEERKFSNLALQGRIERASVLKMQQEKQAREMEEELRGRRDELIQLGVQDPELQKAYLFSPLAFDALKKARTSPDEELRAIDPKALITANKDRLATMTGTVDDVIRNAVRPQQQVEPAKLLEPAGKPSLFAPSTGSQRTRFGQLAAARGLTMEEVARAEAGAGPKMPEPAGQINFEAYPKRAEKELTPEQTQSRLEAKALKLAMEKGDNDPETIAATNAFNSYKVRREKLTPEQDTHAKLMSRYQAVVYGNLPVPPEERKKAEDYLRNYEESKKRTEAKGGSDDKVPAPSSLVSIARTAGANAVRATFGTGATGKQLSFVENPDGSTSVRYTGNDPDMQKQLIRREQEGIIASLRPYMEQGGKVTDRKVEVALQTFGITLDSNRRPVLIDAPAPAPAPAAPALPPRTPGPGRAGQGTPAAAPAAAPRKPTSVPGAPAGHTVGEFVQGKGYAVYNKEGKLIGYATE